MEGDAGQVGTIDPNAAIDLGDEGATLAAPAQGGEPDAAESEAKRHGWMPKEEWVARGKDPGKWNPASAYMDVRNNVLRITREQLQERDAQIAALQAKLDAREQREARVETQLTLDDLRMKIRVAREQGDHVTADGLQDQLVEKQVEAGINARLAAQKTAQPALSDPFKQALADFGTENPTIINDKRLLRQWGVELKVILDSKVTPDVSEAMDMARERIMAIYPDRFRKSEPPLAGGAALGETGGTGGGSASAYGRRTWSQLKPEVRAYAERDIRDGSYSQAQFLANCGPEHFVT